MTDPVRQKLPGLAAGAAVLFAALALAIEPAPELSVSEWSDQHRVVAAESGSPYPGAWQTDRVPFAREPLDTLHPDHPARRTTFVGSAQVVKTELHVNWFGYIVDRAPGTHLVVLPSLDEATKFNRVKLQPAIDASPKIRHRVARENSRDEGASTTAFKRFAGGFSQIVTGSSSKGLQSVSIKYLSLDEVSEFPWDADGRGDPVDQARARQLAYGDDAKELATSTPGIIGACRITAMYEAGDQRRYYVPCGHCGSFQRLTFDNLHFDEEKGRVLMACMGCGVLIDNVEKREMLAKGVWIPTFLEDGEEPIPAVLSPKEIEARRCDPCEGRCRDRQPSYHIWAAYSPFISWTFIWEKHLEAEGSPLKLKVFTQQILGEAWDETHEAPDWEKILAAREDITPRMVPPGALLLTGSADVQKDRIEWDVWGWGPNSEGWLIDTGIVEGDPATPTPWRALVDVIMKQYQASTGATMSLDLFGVDSGYLSPRVYTFVRGRPNVFALDGRHGEHLPPLGTPRRVNTKNARGRIVAKVNLYPVGTHGLKALVMAGLRSLIEGPDEAGRWGAGTLHLPHGLVDEGYIKQITAESLVERKRRDGRIKREWVKAYGRRNEALDKVVYARALAWRLGLDEMTPDQWRLLAQQRGQVLQDQFDLFDKPLTPEPAPTRKSEAPRDDYLGDRAEEYWGKT